MDNNAIHDLEPFWGNWYIDSFIGEGSFGKVYKIYREEFGEKHYAALKIISIPRNASELKQIYFEGMNDESASKYFSGIVEDIYNEIILMSKLKGKTNIVSYEDHNIIKRKQGVGYDILIRMELLTSLNDYVIKHPLNKALVVRMGIDICNALTLCEKRNIIHRDIKPDNIFLSNDGDFKLGDFGIARQMDEAFMGLSIKGSYEYMAPEVYNGKSYDHKVDIYSLGLLLYTFLNNRKPPFVPTDRSVATHGERQEALKKRFTGETLSPPTEATEKLSAIILKACAFSPNDRYKTAMELKIALESLSKDEIGEGVTSQPQDNKDGIDKVSDRVIISREESLFEDTLDRTVILPKEGYDKTVMLTKEEDLDKTVFVINEMGNEVSNNDSNEDNDDKKDADEETFKIEANDNEAKNVDEFIKEELLSEDFSNEELQNEEFIKEEQQKENYYKEDLDKIDLNKDDNLNNMYLVKEDDYNKTVFIQNEVGNNKATFNFKNDLDNTVMITETNFDKEINKDKDISNNKDKINSDNITHDKVTINKPSNTENHLITQTPTGGKNSKKGKTIISIALLMATMLIIVTLWYTQSNKNKEAGVIKNISSQAPDITKEPSKTLNPKETVIPKESNKPEDSIKPIESKKPEETQEPVNDRQVKELVLDYSDKKLSDLFKIKDLDIATDLTIDNNKISSIDKLKESIYLTSLSANSNKITDLSALKNMYKLNYLWLSDNNIKDIKPLMDLITLKLIVLDNNKIKDISALKNLTNLTDLYLNNNNIVDISVLANLKNIEALGLSNNNIKDFSPLYGLKKLKSIDVSGNNISKSDLKKLKENLPKDCLIVK